LAKEPLGRFTLPKVQMERSTLLSGQKELNLKSIKRRSRPFSSKNMESKYNWNTPTSLNAMTSFIVKKWNVLSRSWSWH